MPRITPLPLKNVKIDDPFWNRYIKLVREKVIPYQWEALNDRVPDASRSNCVKNFEIAAGRREGAFYGNAWQDSDLYKWLEAVAFSLENEPDSELERLADGAIELIGAAQQPDGYVNTYYTLKEPGHRFTNLQQGHELYCAGHMIEAAVAYYRATGKRQFLDIAERCADCVDNTFGVEDGKLRGYPGHQEIELALVKLSHTTGEERWLKLAEYFLRERGAKPYYFDLEQEKPGFSALWRSPAHFGGYSQSHTPPLEQKEAVGHAVRAMYMYSAMADLAIEGTPGYAEACETLYRDVTEHKMYITGAIGSTREGESFAGAYDLPGDTAYCETCASVGLMMFSRRMAALTGAAEYIDICERALYNTVLAGISLSGTEFFYVNPLEAEPERIARNPSLSHVEAVRQKWFDCSCCPTNITRTIMGLGEYIYAVSDEGIWVNLFCSGEAADGERRIKVRSEYPYGNRVSITLTGGRYKLFLRNPSNAPVIKMRKNAQTRDVITENGYIVLSDDWTGDLVEILMDIDPKPVYTNLKVQNNAGKAAVVRGPLVYCAEEADNGKNLGSYILPGKLVFEALTAPDGLPPETVALKTAVSRYADKTESLYSYTVPEIEDAELKLIPYFLWANRGVGEMRTQFIKQQPILPENR
ncbi:MAG: glycoside hydrolase family 127 protein [Clostridiales bacterium]|jgi:DUF1680 family protein|nr:glycoside hydrolase family 127 protein [Clostridiales bacterium]